MNMVMALDKGEVSEVKEEKLVKAAKKGAAILDQHLPDQYKTNYHVLEHNQTAGDVQRGGDAVAAPALAAGGDWTDTVVPAAGVDASLESAAASSLQLQVGNEGCSNVLYFLPVFSHVLKVFYRTLLSMLS
ncbi:hypothetical protein C5167_019631 [Papaver somniferum]|uniref:Uncharacterized protein n=1 Tax=Papaver somniferum TaxID=3469 RepID=A0A4Y7IUN4_PAPSO|nr:hypothetical protein C5167_019631 [Papaver somniferum]